MTLQGITFIIGFLALIGGIVGIVRPELVKKFILLFPRSVIPAWILMALCCWLGAKEALGMNMGFIDAYKKYIYFLSPLVFVASVIYMKELLAPRALGGFLLLIAVPILQTIRWDPSPWRVVVVSLIYLWIVYGLVLLMSPWYFRILSTPLLENPQRFKIVAYTKTIVGLLLLLLAAFVY